MRKFENPEIEIVKFEMIDVITTSGEDVTPPGENETPDW